MHDRPSSHRHRRYASTNDKEIVMALKTLKITAADVDADGNYTGAADVTDWPGHIVIAEGLGTVLFATSLRAKGRIVAGADSGIESALDIEAGEGIGVGLGVKAGRNIKAKWSVVAGLDVKSGRDIVSDFGSVVAGRAIAAMWSVTAALHIVAGRGVMAGLSVKAGLSVCAQWVLSNNLTFDGPGEWRTLSAEEIKIRAELRGGTIAYGVHVAPPAACKERQL